MDFISAFIKGMMNSHRELMVFDWIEAAKIIKEK